MAILVTGAAGFIGFHVAAALLERGEDVVGLDSVNDYYDVDLKRARLAQLEPHARFRFVKGDMCQTAVLDNIAAEHPGLDRIVHLAAQAGVRYSLEHPYAYAEANVSARWYAGTGPPPAPAATPRLRQFLLRLRRQHQAALLARRSRRPSGSLYAATKRADELMTYSFSHLHKLPATGLRFFTVYGPWGRPDMAPMLFCRRHPGGQADPALQRRPDGARLHLYRRYRGRRRGRARPPAGRQPRRTACSISAITAPSSCATSST